MTDLSGLTPQEQLTYWTGLVAQYDVHLENALRSMLRRYTGNGIDKHPDEPRNFERLRETAKWALRAAPFTPDARDVGLQMLGDLAAAHQRRVDIVHDIWIIDEATGGAIVADILMGRWDSPPKDPVPLSEFEAAARQLVVMQRRLGAFAMAEPYFRTDGFNLRDDERGPIKLAFFLAVARGEFTQEADRVVMHDPKVYEAMWGKPQS